MNNIKVKISKPSWYQFYLSLKNNKLFFKLAAKQLTTFIGVLVWFSNKVLNHLKGSLNLVKISFTCTS